MQRKRNLWQTICTSVSALAEKPNALPHEAPIKPLLPLYLILIFCAGLGTSSAWAGQPLLFSHAKHTQELGLGCAVCHLYFTSQTNAGVPSNPTCQACHLIPLGSSEEEKKLVRMLQTGLPIQWERVTRLPRHVRYSHSRHVGYARIPCVTCHGEIEKSSQPITRPLVFLDMNFCIRCHRQPQLALTQTAFAGLEQANFKQDKLERLQSYIAIPFRQNQELAQLLKDENFSLAEQKQVTTQMTPVPSISTDCMNCHR